MIYRNASKANTIFIQLLGHFFNYTKGFANNNAKATTKP